MKSSDSKHEAAPLVATPALPDDTPNTTSEAAPLVATPALPDDTPNTTSDPSPDAERAKYCGVPVSVLVISTCLAISLFGDSLLYAVLPVVHDEAGKQQGAICVV